MSEVKGGIPQSGYHQVSFRFYVGLFLVSFALLYLEILINRIFSYILWSNMAYLVISIALLGLGAGAVWDAVVLKPTVRINKRLYRCSILASFSLVGVFIIIGRIPITGIVSTVLLMVLYYILAFIPFFFLGLILATIFRVQVRQVGWIYGVNMAAGGLACIAALGSLRIIGAESGLLLASALLSLSTVLFASDDDRKLKWSGGFLCFIWILLALLQIPLFNFQASSIKQIRTFRNYWPDFRFEYQKWTPLGKIDVISSPTRSLLSIGDKVFPYKCIFNDGSAPTTMLHDNPDLNNTRFYEGSIYGQGYLLGHRDRVLIIGAGGGNDIKTALHFKAKKIIGVEVNKEIIKVVRDFYRDFNGAIYDKAGVSIIHADGRSFLSRSNETYDLIQISGVDTTSALHWGAHMHSENYIFTKEAFLDYFEHLSPEGVIAVWNLESITPRVMLRTCSIALSALRELGAERPEDHFIVLRQGVWVVAVIKKSPFQPEEVEAYLSRLDLSQVRKIVNFEVAFMFWKQVDLKLLYALGHLRENEFCQFFQAASRNEEDEFISSYDYDISVTTDDSPFFYKYYNKVHIGTVGFVGFYLMLLQLLQSAFLCLIFIYLPLRVFRRKQMQPLRHHRMIAIYFLCLGLGYMFVEITLIQRLSLYLGHPMYSMSLVLGTILISSGVGAILFQRSSLTEKKIVTLAALAILFCLLVICLWLLPIFIDKTLYWSLAARFIAAGSIVSLVGLFMGIPFPAGLRSIGRAQSHAVPWAFGINAAASVIGAILCVFIAMESGFSTVILSAAGLYLIAGLFIRAFPSKGEGDTKLATESKTG